MKKSILTQSKKKKAMTLAQQGRFADAQPLLARVCDADRTDVESWFTLGVVNGKLDKFDESLDCFRRAIALQPGNSLIHYNLGLALRGLNRFAEAEPVFREVIRLQPDRPEPYINLGFVLLMLGKLDEAAVSYREVLKITPNDSDALAYLGRILQARGDIEEAVQCFRRALEIAPGYASVHDNLGSAYCDQGLYVESIQQYRRAIEISSHGDSTAHANLLLTLQYVPDADPLEVFEEHKRWAGLHANPLTTPAHHANSPDPGRRLKVGYVSADFRVHSVAFFFEPLLVAHNREVVEIFCYSAVPRPDETTERLRALTENWRDAANMPEVRLAEQIRADGIDILVDLSGHTAHNRLRAFASRPAPIQVSWLGYPNTTGLTQIDYRFTDALADPAGNDRFFTERLYRLPGCFLCYQPLAGAPEVAPLPAGKNGHVTFGSFNNLSKINPGVVALWARLLHAVPDSRLFVKNPSLSDKATAERYYGLFEQFGVPRGRVELRGRTATQTEHLALYAQLDIALDTFPYNGTTTTCEALWMGVPVVTLAGAHHAGRVGVSLLTAARLDGWIAQAPEEYVALAAHFAADRQRLAELRAGLRAHLAASPLCDRDVFSRNVELAYREMWRKWCAA